MHRVLMCHPAHFRVDYSINPWMKVGSIDNKKAALQWENLVSVYKSLGVEVNVINQNQKLPDMVFATDQGIPGKSGFILSNFRYPERRGETKEYSKWYRERGLKLIPLPGSVFFEGGGDSIKTDKRIFLGTGIRTGPEAVPFIEKYTGKKVIALTLINQHFFHLDTCLFVLNENTAFYVPGAFSKESEEILKKEFRSLTPFQKQESENFASNSVSVRKTVLVQKGSPVFTEKLKEFGYKTIEMDVSEFIKAGGGIHCLTGEF